MLLEQLSHTMLAEVERKLENRPIVIVYPRHRSHGALLAMLMQVYRQSLIYYHLREDDQTLMTWLDHMVRDEAFPESFGSQTRAALTAKGTTPEELAEAFGADLGTLRSSSFMLLLDAFDRLKMSDAVDRFFRALPNYMPNHGQVVINARLMDVQPWNDLLHAGLAQVVGNEKALGGGIYGDDPRQGQLEVWALAGGFVYIDGRPVTSWDGSFPRQLFYYFVDHAMVTRDEIFSVFWPHMSIKEATNVFHVTKRKISERLGYELTNYSGGFYIPSPRLSVHYDARVFEHAMGHATEEEDQAPAYWYEAVQLYRTDFLPNVHTPWVSSRREAIRNKYAQALIGLGRFHRGLNEPDRALGYLLRALKVKPDWEDVHRDVMLIYSQQGRRDEAIRQYKQLEKTLLKMFNIRPSKDTIRLYEVVTAL